MNRKKSYSYLSRNIIDPEFNVMKVKINKFVVAVDIIN